MRVIEINDIVEMEQLPVFHVDKLLWGTEKCPKTYGYLGFIKEDGFYLRMVCWEKNPCRKYKKEMDPVYKDSAMEAFFQFFPKGFEKKEEAIYLNFEVNANGVMLAEYGTDRENRIRIPKKECRQMYCCVERKRDCWIWDLKIPVLLLEKIYGPLNLEKDSVFRCNFCKISENPDIEHYAAYVHVGTKMPNFHEPQYFAKAVIT